MDWPTMQLVLSAAEVAGAEVLDITGGAPEMHPNFREFVRAATRQSLRVIVRSNLTILLEDGYHDVPEFFRAHRVCVIASLPCYLENNVDQQRGKGVYAKSIEAIRRLNAIGYGVDDDLELDLVYNPLGPSLPPEQEQLEQDYKRELLQRFGIRFTRLFTIANMPIGRFLRDLQRHGRDVEYLDRLRSAFNPATIDGLMCRHQLHIGYDGTLYDCDFNFALGLPVERSCCGHIAQFDPQTFLQRRVVTGEHCFGCSAGCGSSCGGALT
jgi:radical SAM/Cys-rich protein